MFVRSDDLFNGSESLKFNSNSNISFSNYFLESTLFGIQCMFKKIFLKLERHSLILILKTKRTTMKEMVLFLTSVLLLVSICYGLPETGSGQLIKDGLLVTGDRKLMNDLEDAMTVDNTLRFKPSPVTGRCQCANSSCGCCQRIKHFHIDNEVCITVKYLKKESGVLLTVTWGGNVVYHKEVSIRNPPAVCFHIPFVKHLASVCLQLYNLEYEKGLSGCARLSLRFLVIKPLKVDLGCFHIPVSEYELNATLSSRKASNYNEMSFGHQKHEVYEQSIIEKQEMLNGEFRIRLNERLNDIEVSDYFSYIFGGSYIRHDRKTFA